MARLMGSPKIPPEPDWALIDRDEGEPVPFDVARLERALQLIHGVVVPLPNRCSPKEYAAIIDRWYRDPATAGRQSR